MTPFKEGRVQSERPTVWPKGGTAADSVRGVWLKMCFCLYVLNSSISLDDNSWNIRQNDFFSPPSPSVVTLGWTAGGWRGWLWVWRFEDDNGAEETLHRYSSINNTVSLAGTVISTEKDLWSLLQPVQKSAVFTINTFPIDLNSHINAHHPYQKVLKFHKLRWWK